MIRTLLILFGLVEIVAPKPIIEACERIGLENPDHAQLRPRAALLARLEGALFVWVLVRGRDQSPLTSRLLGATGALAVVYPTPLIRFSQSFAYENSSDLELRPWVRPAARLLGALYLAVVALSGASTDESGPA
ncbi:hypothetical protein GRX03_09085 [Halovenus sp. WSH3]|uniref:Uncharacterized protein n=1 Tax=Halovenus carboxidivorans TaxID=2692199 RepID=A0A6B0T6E0_9EURY|nr:hypothetical protein [Halovenus carboxidivorans]MXR51756.1 hypothetical protein [Halovenus carboxidivorans]